MDHPNPGIHRGSPAFFTKWTISEAPVILTVVRRKEAYENAPDWCYSSVQESTEESMRLLCDSVSLFWKRRSEQLNSVTFNRMTQTICSTLLMLWDTCFSFSLILEINFSLQVESHEKRNCSLHIILLGQLSLHNILNEILLYLGISRSYHVYT